MFRNSIPLLVDVDAFDKTIKTLHFKAGPVRIDFPFCLNLA